ncbi:MAG TPA: nucleotidyl transferase AbiEii/AbiGii toxin family protein [Myxococcota bacterium]|nr:nucleotidyl transferase AbiEii/AbiGii toxin family protein [Myxococcota bacterium]
MDVLAALSDALPAGTFAIVGAVARNAWAPPRATTDLDLALAATTEATAAAEAALVALGYRCVRRNQTDSADDLPDLLIFRRDDPDLRQVDLLIAKTPFEEQVLRRAALFPIGNRPIPVATAEDLLVYKLLAGRPRDWEDVRAIVRTRARAGATLDWAHVEHWCAFWGVSERLASLRAERIP